MMMVMIYFLTKSINSNKGAGPAHSCAASHHYQDDQDEDDDDDDVDDSDGEDDDFMPMYGADLQWTTMGCSPGLMCSLKSRTNL